VSNVRARGLDHAKFALPVFSLNSGPSRKLPDGPGVWTVRTINGYQLMWSTSDVSENLARFINIRAYPYCTGDGS